MKVSGPKHAVNINFIKISTKIMQTLHIPLENALRDHHFVSGWSMVVIFAHQTTSIVWKKLPLIVVKL